MEVCRSTSPAYVYRLFFCPFCIFLFNHAVFFSLHSLDLQLLHISTKYSAWGRDNYYFCLMAVPIFLSMFFVVSTRNLADTWLFEILWGPHVFFCFTRFPLRSEESFIIFSLGKLKQETQRNPQNSGVREERSRSLKKKITEVNHGHGQARGKSFNLSGLNMKKAVPTRIRSHCKKYWNEDWKRNAIVHSEEDEEHRRRNQES